MDPKEKNYSYYRIITYVIPFRKQMESIYIHKHILMPLCNNIKTYSLISLSITFKNKDFLTTQYINYYAYSIFFI